MVGLLWRTIKNNTIEESLHELVQGARMIKEVARGCLKSPTSFRMAHIFDSLRQIGHGLIFLGKTANIILVLFVYRIIKRVFFFKLPAVIYLAIFDYFDQRRYHVMKSRGSFDAIVCIFLFLLLLYSLLTINLETARFREAYQQQRMALKANLVRSE
ncbi:hypothetical protein NEHOM01_0421 [Nematocida homosporus]|uniref:uncharacterized protein n=1 Tax=Nematocida homosporus TaxID=1912981 RepID=UPI002220D892|nr:uncharacterized protein NEHOM01_0421 [Nematocida homosporus]KAI5184819.1 hypothetical protein NEHOM01_0421 [Nematocida homosporus]